MHCGFLFLYCLTQCTVVTLNFNTMCCGIGVGVGRQHTKQATGRPTQLLVM